MKQEDDGERQERSETTEGELRTPSEDYNNIVGNHDNSGDEKDH